MKNWLILPDFEEIRRERKVKVWRLVPKILIIFNLNKFINNSATTVVQNTLYYTWIHYMFDRDITWSPSLLVEINHSVAKIVFINEICQNHINIRSIAIPILKKLFKWFKEILLSKIKQLKLINCEKLSIVILFVRFCLWIYHLSRKEFKKRITWFRRRLMAPPVEITVINLFAVAELSLKYFSNKSFFFSFWRKGRIWNNEYEIKLSILKWSSVRIFLNWTQFKLENWGYLSQPIDQRSSCTSSEPRLKCSSWLANNWIYS